MASPAGLTIQVEKDRSGLVSSFQRSYGTVKDSTPAIIVSGRPGKFFVHTVQEEDTLQGLAVKYGVTTHHIQRLNNLWDSESIQSRTELKIPSSPHLSRSHTPSPIPKSKRNHRMASSMQDIRSTSQDGEEEVKRKPLRKNHTLEPYQEKSIASLLSAADVSMLEGQKFNEKLALKTAHLKQPADAYNRPRPPPRVSLSPFSSSSSSSSSSHRSDHHSSTGHSSLEALEEKGKLPRKEEERRRKVAKESSESLSNSRDTIEDNIFEL